MSKIFYYSFLFSAEDEVMSMTRTLASQSIIDKPFIVKKPNGVKFIGIFVDETERVNTPGFVHHLNQFLKDINK